MECYWECHTVWLGKEEEWRNGITRVLAWGREGHRQIAGWKDADLKKLAEILMSIHGREHIILIQM